MKYAGFAFVIVVFASSLIFCILPRIISKTTALRGVYAYVSVFTAGMQLATILVDIIPHLGEGAHNHSNDNHSHGKHSHDDHPVAADKHDLVPYMVCGLTFIILLAVDVIFLHGDHEHKHKEHNKEEHTHEHNEEHKHDDKEHTNDCHGGHTPAGHKEGSCGGNIGTCNTASISKSKSKAKALTCLFAISLHSFFEGLAVDPKLNFASTYNVGILFHKLLESFAIGVSIFDSPFSVLTNLQLVLLYSLLTPAGILSGSFFSTMNKSIPKYFMALSLGSLLFVVFIEMIGHSFTGKDNSKKLAVLFGGYVVGCFAIRAAHPE